MFLETRIINPIQFSGWNELLLSNKYSCLFHSSNWAKVIKDTYNYKPVYFTLENNQKLISLIPIMEIHYPSIRKRGVSLPFTDCCCPIIYNKNHFSMMFNKIIDTGRKSKWKFVEIRFGRRLPHAIQDQPCRHYYLHTVHILPDIHRILKNLRDSTKRNIKKAIRSRVQTEFFYTADSIKEFYKLNCLTRKYHGLPPQPYIFFKNIYKHIISKKLGFVILAKYNDKIIAGAVFFTFKNKAIFKYGASDRNYHFLRANNLVMWRAIEWCAKNEYDSFCMGRTDLNTTGLSQFKEGWGTTRSKISYFRYNIPQSHFEIKNISIPFLLSKTAKALPIPMLKLVGNLTYKYVG